MRHGRFGAESVNRTDSAFREPCVKRQEGLLLERQKQVEWYRGLCRLMRVHETAFFIRGGGERMQGTQRYNWLDVMKRIGIWLM